MTPILKYQIKNLVIRNENVKPYHANIMNVICVEETGSETRNGTRKKGIMIRINTPESHESCVIGCSRTIRRTTSLFSCVAKRKSGLRLNELR